MYGKLLNTGKTALINSINNNQPITIDHIDIGTEFGRAPLTNETGVSPAISQTIAGAFLYKTKISQDEIVFTIVLEHTIFGQIGNLVPVTSNGQAFFKLMFPVQLDKNKTNPSKNSPGDKYFLHYRLFFPNLIKACTNIPDYVVDMAHVQNFDTFDFTSAAEYEQYMVDNQDGRMVLTGKIDGIFYGTPWMMNLKDKGYWRYFGGDAGDNYKYVKKEAV